MVTPAGFEPGIAAVKGRCPIRLDERAMTAPRGSCIYLRGDLCTKGIAADDDIIDPDSQDCRQDYQIINGGHRIAPLPLVDRLGMFPCPISAKLSLGKA